MANLDEIAHDVRILKPYTELPPRSHLHTLSPFYLMNVTRKVHVPWSALIQDCAPLDHEDESCDLTTQIVKYTDVVVVRAMNFDGEVIYGWFVKRKSNLLQRLNHALITQLKAAADAADARRANRSMVTHWPDVCLTSHRGIVFYELAIIRFERKNVVLLEAAARDRGKKKARANGICKRTTSPCTRPSRGKLKQPSKSNVSDNGEQQHTCVICLNETEDIATKQCKCSTPVCATCDERMRGLCPVCDRTLLNGVYECHHCGGFDELRYSGLPCACCGNPVLCYGCYRAYEECFACDMR